MIVYSWILQSDLSCSDQPKKLFLLCLFEFVVQQFTDGYAFFCADAPVPLGIGDDHREVARVLVGIEVDHAAQDIPETDAVAEADGAGGTDGDVAVGDVGVVADALDEGPAFMVDDALDVGHRESGRIVGQGHFDRTPYGAEA